MLRTALLWGNTINLDSDYSKYIETVSDPWVIEGFAVEGGKVKPGKAWVKVTRSNGESLFVLVQNTQDIPVSLNGDVFIGIEVAQNAIDNGLMNNEEGTGIASIKVWPQKPNQNYLLLAVWQGGRLSDKREIIPKLQSLSQRTSTLEEKFETAKPGIDAASKMPEKIKLLEASVNKLTTVNGIRQELDFKVEGRASATWNAPENGLLEYKFSREGNSGSAALGGMDLPVRHWENIPNYLFVQKGQQIFLSVDNNYRQGLYKIQLTAFIPL